MHAASERGVLINTASVAAHDRQLDEALGKQCSVQRRWVDGKAGSAQIGLDGR